MLAGKIRLFIVASVALLIIVFVVGALRARAKRRWCLMNLASMGVVLRLYAFDHVGNYPSNMAVCLRSGYVSNPGLFFCGHKGRAAEEATNADDWMDYIYIPWGTGTNTPPGYPLMYDRRFSNHGGRGVNVLLADGSVHWDECGNSIATFAREHPDVHLPLPEDCDSCSGSARGQPLK